MLVAGSIRNKLFKNKQIVLLLNLENVNNGYKQYNKNNCTDNRKL